MDKYLKNHLNNLNNIQSFLDNVAERGDVKIGLLGGRTVEVFIEGKKYSFKVNDAISHILKKIEGGSCIDKKSIINKLAFINKMGEEEISKYLKNGSKVMKTRAKLTQLKQKILKTKEFRESKGINWQAENSGTAAKLKERREKYQLDNRLTASLLNKWGKSGNQHGVG